MWQAPPQFYVLGVQADPYCWLPGCVYKYINLCDSSENSFFRKKPIWIAIALDRLGI
jgi:hypothetical protein